MATRVGLLFVHGIGEQKRFEHLKTSVAALAELLKRSVPDAQVSVIDRTAENQPAPDRPAVRDEAPITLHLISGGETRRFDCHEVWWADLGARKSLMESVRFWTWGLGQWAAPIYREADPTHMAKLPKAAPRPRVILPRSAAGAPGVEITVRLRLALAALTAIFSFFSWSILKRASGLLFKTTPDPDLIAQYVGDVRTYERRASPNSSPVSDPGHPLRVAIRRRMVTQMVAMAARDLDGWFVIAHSLGTVVAYNGLTELGHTLPNYIDEKLWQEVKTIAPRLRDVRGVERRVDQEIGDMMPGRPPWLAPDDVINRTNLFEKLQGVLTYGSPLDKFAAIWPRIVASADDRTDGGSVFGDKTWLNLSAPHDPVAGVLDSYSASKGGPSGAELERVLPKLRNWVAPPDIWLGLSHMRYFTNDELFRASKAIEQREAIVRWIFCGEPLPNDGSVEVGQGMRTLIFAGYLGITAMLGLLAAGLIAAAGGTVAALITGAKPDWPDSLQEFACASLISSALVVGLAAALVCGAGLLRCWRETRLNWLLADHDAAQAPGDTLKAEAVLYLRGLAGTAAGMALIGLPILGVAIAVQLSAANPLERWSAALTALLLLVATTVVLSFASKPRR